ITAYDGSTPLPELFPGADEVDWLAVDGYNWGSARDWGWQSYADIFAPTLNALHKLAPRRPLMIAETGSAPDRRSASWVTEPLTSARGAGRGLLARDTRSRRPLLGHEIVPGSLPPPRPTRK